MLTHYGIKVDEEKQKVPEKCPTCGMFNPVDAEMCSKCGKPVSLEAALLQEERDNEEKSKIEQKFEDYKKETDEKIADMQRQHREDVTSPIIDEAINKRIEDILKKHKDL